MSRYGYFESDFSPVAVSTTFDTKKFGDLELVGTIMQYHSIHKSIWDRIGVGGSVLVFPAFWKDLLFFGACDKNFYCLGLDGKERWRFRTNGVILTNAVVHGDLVFFGCYDNTIYALDCMTGRLAWKFQTSGPNLSYNIVHDGIVYVSSYDGNIYGLDEKTGKEVWKIPTVGAQIGAFERDGVLFFGYRGGLFYAYDIQKRRLLWTFTTQKDACGWKDCSWKGNVYIGSFEGNIYAIERKAGNLAWKFSAGDVAYPPSVSGDRLYACSRDFCAYCLDAGTGRLIWKFKTGGWTICPIEAEGMVYFGSFDNNVYCLDADSGRELWRFKTNGSVDEVCYNQGRLYFGSWDCHMYCLDAQTGKLIWKFKTSLGTPSPIEPPETGAVTSAQVTWQTSEEETKKDKKGEQQLSDYADTKNEYASSGMGDYLGKKKRGYV